MGIFDLCRKDHYSCPCRPFPCSEMVTPCARLSKMATNPIWVTKPSQSSNSLHLQNSYPEEYPYLASISYRSNLEVRYSKSWGQRHCRTRVIWSRVLRDALFNWLTVYKNGYGAEEAISTPDTSQNLPDGFECISPSRWIFGRICTTFTGSVFSLHSLSVIVNAFVDQ